MNLNEGFHLSLFFIPHTFLRYSPTVGAKSMT